MAKYIPVDKLIAEMERMRDINKKAFMAEHITADMFHGRTQAINHISELINSLQQQQPSEICSKCAHHGKNDGYCYYPYGGMQRLINENGVYECTGFYEQEQPDVDIDKEVQRWKNKHGVVGMDDLWLKFARHFYKFRLNTKK